MEKKFYVAKIFGDTSFLFAEVFDNKVDAESYAALMSRAKKEDYIILEKISVWLKPLEED